MTLWTPFAAGQRITAGKLNALVGEWTDYTPVWAADAGTTTLGNGTLEGKYQRTGNTIEFRIMMQWGSTSTQSSATANWNFSLPFTPSAADGTVVWPCNIWIMHQPGGAGSTYRWTGGAYVDPPTSTVVAMTYNGGNGYLDSASFPSTTGNPGLSPDEVVAVAGSRVNVFGSYQAIN